MITTAMILCAGRGERMRPFTDTTPKPLYTIQGKTLLEHHLYHLKKAGISRVVINHAWLGDQIKQHLGDGSQFNLSLQYVPEPPGGLETGGGIVNALPVLGKQPFIVINGDILTNFDFKTLHLRENCKMHLVLGRHQGSNPFKKDYGLNETNRMVLKSPKTLIFLGIACYHPVIFESLKPGFFPLKPILDTAIDARIASGEIFSGEWYDVQNIPKIFLQKKLLISTRHGRF